MGPGGLPGLQNRVWGGDPVLGGFDSYTLPPKKVPSIDKKILVSRWFVICPKVLCLRRFRAFCFLSCSNRCCVLPVCFGLEPALIADNFNDFKANR